MINLTVSCTFLLYIIISHTNGGLAMRRYELDFKHSSICFTIKHMRLARVKGFFESYQANIHVCDIKDFNQFDIHFEIDVASISTSDGPRDTHLISADFFHADKYPKIIFTCTDIEKLTNNAYLLGGNLTIKDVTNYVKFNVLYNGHEISPTGTEVHGFTCISSIKRSDFGLTYNKILESGNLLIDNEVEITVELELFT